MIEIISMFAQALTMIGSHYQKCILPSLHPVQDGLSRIVELNYLPGGPRNIVRVGGMVDPGSLDD